jgi:hypothetical protein
MSGAGRGFSRRSVKIGLRRQMLGKLGWPQRLGRKKGRLRDRQSALGWRHFVIGKVSSFSAVSTTKTASSLAGAVLLPLALTP